MEICVLGSGSSGNAIYVATEDTRLLIDAGLSALAIRKRLKNATGLNVEELDGILFTHDHTDHFCGVEVLHRRYGAKRLLANEGTAAGIEMSFKKFAPQWEIFETGNRFQIGPLTIDPFNVPHDASDPVGFIISDGRSRLGIATDLGSVTTVVKHRLTGCDALVLEFNHDIEMLRQSDRPRSLQQRILGSHGHLCNEDAAELLETIMTPQLKILFPAHLSSECNTTAYALYAIRNSLQKMGRSDVKIEMTFQDQPTTVITI